MIKFLIHVVLSLIVSILLLFQLVFYTLITVDIPVAYSSRDYYFLTALFILSLLLYAAKIIITDCTKHQGSIFIVIVGIICIFFWYLFHIRFKPQIRADELINLSGSAMIFGGLSVNVIVTVHQIWIWYKYFKESKL